MPGAPLAHEDHAVRALLCRPGDAGRAAPLQRGGASHARVEVQIRVGPNSGEVVVRAIGNDLHMDYSAIGETTHLAARMEQLAPPGDDPPDRGDAAPGGGLWRGSTRWDPCLSRGSRRRWRSLTWSGRVRCGTASRAAVARGLTRFVGCDTELVPWARPGAGGGRATGRW